MLTQLEKILLLVCLSILAITSSSQSRQNWQSYYVKHQPITKSFYLLKIDCPLQLHCTNKIDGIEITSKIQRPSSDRTANRIALTLYLKPIIKPKNKNYEYHANRRHWLRGPAARY
jgi:hypothetical protein